MTTNNYYGSEQQAKDLLRTASHLAAQIATKEKSYKGSWQSRGGIGAFMMLARKWDRIEPTAKSNGYDIWRTWDAMEEFADGDMNDIEDLCGYLLHVINEMRVKRPRESEQEYQESKKSALVVEYDTTAPDNTKYFIGGRTLDSNEVRLTEEEWHTLEKTGTVKLANCILTRITRENIINDNLFNVSPLTGFMDPPDGLTIEVDGVINRDVKAGERVTSADFQPNPTPGTWEESHPHNYPSAGNQCPQCNATSPSSTGNVCKCRLCGCEFPKKDQGISAFDQKFPQAMINRSKSQPETNDIIKG